jgi:hypothetical protein
MCAALSAQATMCTQSVRVSVFMCVRGEGGILLRGAHVLGCGDVGTSLSVLISLMSDHCTGHITSISIMRKAQQSTVQRTCAPLNMPVSLCL